MAATLGVSPTAGGRSDQDERWGPVPEDRETTVQQAGSDGEANPVRQRGAGQARDGVAARAGPGPRRQQRRTRRPDRPGCEPEDGIHAGDKAPDSDASVTSPGAWTALAAPGAPDGEVDTRS